MTKLNDIPNIDSAIQDLKAAFKYLKARVDELESLVECYGFKHTRLWRHHELTEIFRTAMKEQ